MDIATECWSAGHLKWVLMLGVPMIIVYVVGFPVFSLILLYRIRHKLSQPEIIRYFLLLYQGLKHDRYYWEIVNSARKSSLIFSHVFITNDFKVMKALLGALIMFSCCIIQGRLRPFKIGVISDLEHREMLCSILILYGGLIFVQEDTSLDFIKIIVFVFIMIMTVRFWILWIFCVVTVYKKYRILDIFGGWMKRAFCLKVDEEDEAKM